MVFSPKNVFYTLFLLFKIKIFASGRNFLTVESPTSYEIYVIPFHCQDNLATFNSWIYLLYNFCGAALVSLSHNLANIKNVIYFKKSNELLELIKMFSNDKYITYLNECSVRVQVFSVISVSLGVVPFLNTWNIPNNSTTYVPKVKKNRTFISVWTFQMLIVKITRKNWIHSGTLIE